MSLLAKSDPTSCCAAVCSVGARAVYRFELSSFSVAEYAGGGDAIYDTSSPSSCDCERVRSDRTATVLSQSLTISNRLQHKVYRSLLIQVLSLSLSSPRCLHHRPLRTSSTSCPAWTRTSSSSQRKATSTRPPSRPSGDSSNRPLRPSYHLRCRVRAASRPRQRGPYRRLRLGSTLPQQQLRWGLRAARRPSRAQPSL